MSRTRRGHDLEGTSQLCPNMGYEWALQYSQVRECHDGRYVFTRGIVYYRLFYAGDACILMLFCRAAGRGGSLLAEFWFCWCWYSNITISRWIPWRLRRPGGHGAYTAARQYSVQVDAVCLMLERSVLMLWPCLCGHMFVLWQQNLSMGLCIRYRLSCHHRHKKILTLLITCLSSWVGKN